MFCLQRDFISKLLGIREDVFIDTLRDAVCKRIGGNEMDVMSIEQ